MEASICKNCKTFFGCQDGLCSKCFRESKSKPTLPADTTSLLNTVPKLIEEIKEIPAPQNIPSDKCYKCSKVLGPVNFHCKCGLYFCTRHRYPEDHCCTFDHKAAGIRKLSEENPVVEAPKFQRLH